jgi:molecular chaperone GrpE
MIKKEKQENKNELQEVKELLQRKQAELENYRKQVDKRFIEMKELANKNLIFKLLPVVDNFELALKSADTNSNPEDFLKGVELIYSQLFSFLENNHIQPMVTEKKEFDPYLHEALMKVNSDLPENVIIEELQKGFMLHDKVLRHAKVKISAGMKKEDDCKECATEDCSCETIE